MIQGDGSVGVISFLTAYHPPPMSLARAIILTSERGGAAARVALFLHSRWGGQRHAPGYHSKAFQEFTAIALSELTPVISNPQQYTSTHSVSIVRARLFCMHIL